jgi:hypothetical protein
LIVGLLSDPHEQLAQDWFLALLPDVGWKQAYL